MVRLRPSRTMFPCYTRHYKWVKTADHMKWLQERKRNILLDGLAHQVEPEGAESEGTPLPPLQKD